MGTTNQKLSIADTHTQKEKAIKTHTKDLVIKSQQKGAKEERKTRATKITTKQLTKWQ